MGTIPFEPIPLPVALSLKACYTSVASGYWHRHEAPLRQLSSLYCHCDSTRQRPQDLWHRKGSCSLRWTPSADFPSFALLICFCSESFRSLSAAKPLLAPCGYYISAEQSSEDRHDYICKMLSCSRGCRGCAHLYVHELTKSGACNIP